MADRRPIVIVDGKFQELKDGDTLVGGGSGSGGATTFIGLSDTPADFSGEAGNAVIVNQTEDGLEFGVAPGGGGGASYPDFASNGGRVLAVNDAEDDVEWVDNAGSTGYLMAKIDYEVSSSTTQSSSAFATKGNVFEILKDTTIVAVKSYVSSGQTIKLFVAKVTHVDDGDAILDNVFYESDEIVITETGYKEFIVPKGASFSDGDRVYIGYTRTDGTETSVLAVPFSGGTSNDDNEIWEWKNSFRYEENDLNEGDTIPAYVSSSAVGMLLSTVEAGYLDSLTVGEGVPTGGTAGQILKKIDDVDFNTEWVDDPTQSDVVVLDYWDADNTATLFTITEDTIQNSNASAEADFRQFASGALPLPEGKVYWEVEFSGDIYDSYIGVVAAAYRDQNENTTTGLTDQGWGWSGTGRIYHNGTGDFSQPTFNNTNSVLMFAYDRDTNELWLGVDGVWDADPATDPANITVAAIADPYPAANARRAQATVTLRQQASECEHTIPAGFSYIYAPIDNTKMVQSEKTGTTYDVTDLDLAGNVIRKMNNAETITVTVPPSLVGTEPATFLQTGAGTVTFAAGSGVTINSVDGNLNIASQYGSATLIPDISVADTFFLVGHLAS